MVQKKFMMLVILFLFSSLNAMGGGALAAAGVLPSQQSSPPQAPSEKQETLQCPICISAINEGTTIIRTKCGHTFCLECMIGHLQSEQQALRTYTQGKQNYEKQCPSCRRWITCYAKCVNHPAGIPPYINGQKKPLDVAQQVALREFENEYFRPEQAVPASQPPAGTQRRPPDGDEDYARNLQQDNNGANPDADLYATDEELLANGLLAQDGADRQNAPRPRRRAARRNKAGDTEFSKPTFFEKLQNNGLDTIATGLFLGFLIQGEIGPKPATQKEKESLAKRRLFYLPASLLSYFVLYKLAPHRPWTFERVASHMVALITGMSVPHLFNKKKTEPIRKQDKPREKAPTNV